MTPGDRLGLEAGEAGDAVVLVDDVVADAQVGERRQPAPRRAPARRRGGGGRGAGTGSRRAAAPARRSRRRAAPRRRTAAGSSGGGAPPRKARLDAVEVVAGALGLAPVLEGDDHPVAGSQLLLELRLGLADAPRRRARRLRAEGELLPRVGVGDPQRCALVQRVRDVHVEAARVASCIAAVDVLPVVAERARDLVGGGDQDRGVVGDQVERRAEAVQREELRQVRSLGISSADVLRFASAAGG